MVSEETLSLSVIIVLAVLIAIIAMVAIPHLSSGLPEVLSKALD